MQKYLQWLHRSFFKSHLITKADFISRLSLGTPLCQQQNWEPHHSWGITGQGNMPMHRPFITGAELLLTYSIFNIKLHRNNRSLIAKVEKYNNGSSILHWEWLRWELNTTKHSSASCSAVICATWHILSSACISSRNFLWNCCYISLCLVETDKFESYGEGGRKRERLYKLHFLQQRDQK